MVLTTRYLPVRTFDPWSPSHLTDDPSEFGIQHSPDVPSTRVAGGDAAKCPPQLPCDKGARREGSAGFVLRK
jgi:hypothetical protein